MDQVYDGFISYSHAADGLLAPRLQSALQRFAKPWWKRRAVRIFRDESSLSANPHLWSSITEALDTSGWFVLLLSPDAAQSEWVNQEIAYWVKHRDPKKILPVVTDGEFGWNGDVTGNTAPAALAGVFSEEPRWVDLRGVDTDTELDLQNPAFAAAVADIASSIRGIPKDELASEEVRQHRRTVRTAGAAGIGLLALAVAAGLFGVSSLRNADEAERQQQLAEDNAAEAETQAETARANEAAALEQAAIAEARRLAGAARSLVVDNPELSMLLSLEALSVVPEGPVEGEVTVLLRDAMLENRLLLRLPIPEGLNLAQLSPDGTTIYHLSVTDRALSALEVETAAVEWTRSIAGQQGDAIALGVNPDGSQLALAVEAASEDSPGRIVVFDSATGTVTESLAPGSCSRVFMDGRGFSADGRFFSVTAGVTGCGIPDEGDSDWAVVYETETWETVLRYDALGFEDEPVSFESFDISADGTTALITGFPDVTVVLTFPDLVPVASYDDALFAVLAPAGNAIAFDDFTTGGSLLVTRVVNLESGSIAAADPDIQVGAILRPFRFSPDGSMLSIVGDGRDAVIDTPTGSIVLELYRDQLTYDHSWTSDGSKLLTAHEDELLLWSIEPDERRFAAVIASGDWEGLAVEMLTRSFTAGECSIYRIDPCPSLEELRERW